MNHRYLIPAAVLAALAIPGAVAANNNTVNADCAGLTFNMPRGETGTVVTARLDGRPVRTDTIATFGAPLAYTIGSPDQTVSHTWVVTVDSVFNADQSVTRTVAACTAPTTTAPVPSSSTTPPTTAPAVAVVATTVGVDVGPPPTPPTVTTVTTPGRPTVTTVPVLPATGPGTFAAWLTFAAAVSFGVGQFAYRLSRRGRK